MIIFKTLLKEETLSTENTLSWQGGECVFMEASGEEVSKRKYDQQ